MSPFACGTGLKQTALDMKKSEGRKRLFAGAVIGYVLAVTEFAILQIIASSDVSSTSYNEGNAPVDRATRVISQSLLLSQEVMNREINHDDVPDIVTGALQALDPYSGYLREEMTSRITSESRSPGKSPLMVGILGDVTPDGYFVRSSFPMSPADGSGIQTGDRLVAVDGDDVSALSGIDAAAALKSATRASEGKVLELAFDRHGERVFVKLEPRVLPENFVYDMGRVEGVLHVHIRGFFNGMAEDVERVLARNFEKGGVSGVVLDLRGNSGGLTSEAKKLAELFFPEGTLLYTEEGRRIETSTIQTDGTPVFPYLKMVVLVDENSASASEIFASAVQAGGFGTIVGVPSYGKGTIQNVYPFEDGSGAIKITVGEYKSASGEVIDGIGVIPDIIVDEEMSEFQKEDPAFSAAVDRIKGR
jgi:carboxyl-terminal processing protease